MSYPLMLTAEIEGPDWVTIAEERSDSCGVVVIKIGSWEIGRVPLTYHQLRNGRDGIEEATALWLAKSLAEREPTQAQGKDAV